MPALLKGEGEQPPEHSIAMTLQLPVPTHQFLIDGISLERTRTTKRMHIRDLSEVKTMKDVAVV